MKSQRFRGVWSYLLLQVPDVLLAGLILLLLHRWAGLPSAWSVGLFAVWVLKDLGMYFLLRDVLMPSRLGTESLVGARAVVREPLAPRGFIMLDGELWSAESLRSPEVIRPGSSVIVRASRGLTLLVEAEDPVGGEAFPGSSETDRDAVCTSVSGELGWPGQRLPRQRGTSTRDSAARLVI